MSRQALVAAARRTIAHAKAGTVPIEAGQKRVPVSNYYDPQRWQLEMDRVFRRVPLMLGFSCELQEKHSYKALDVMGVPVLLIRGDDGVLRSFVNMCSHRGAIVMEEGSGVARRFNCPYHAWSYDATGALVGILDRANFGDVDMSCMGLTALPVAERAGIVFGGITPGMPFDIDQYLCGYGEMLEHLDLKNCTLVGRQLADGPNWKLAYDGYLDFYHLPILHKETFGAEYNNKTINDAWGPHQRNVQPDARIMVLDEMPEDEWPMAKLTGGVWTIFPHVSIAGFEAGGRLFMISQLFPGDTPETSVTVQNFVATFTPDDESMTLIDKQMDFLLHVVRDEDYYTGKRIQRTVKTGAKSEFLFGRNEGPCQRFHGWVDDILAADDDASLAALFASAEEFHHP
jgi:phenylpropionate dioxygenase-like ring-hydroxylating dioxygenase large terminal subunit